ncbi:MAG: ABC transporter permease [Malacoplasma sp.]
MIKYIFKRLGFSILALFILVTLIFFIMQLIPGYPIEKGLNETAEDFAKRLEALGLTKPIIVQYFEYWKGIFTNFEFGKFFSQSTSVSSEFLTRVSFTMPIAATAFVIGISLGMLLGSIAAVYRGKWQDTIVNIFAILFLSVPSFVIATFIIKIASSLGFSTTVGIPGSEGYDIWHTIGISMLPILSLVFTLTPSITYYTRNELVDVLNQDYIKTALAKGMTYRAVVFKHGIKNALIPIISISIPSFLIVIGGTLVVERFFGIPGAADKLIESIEKKEFYYVMFNALFISSIYFLLQILADFIYTIIDPRIKLAESNEMSIYKKFKYFLFREKNVYDWKSIVKKDSYFIIDIDSELHKHIIENNLISGNKISFNSSEIDNFDLNATKDTAVLDNKLYKIYFSRESI